MIPHEHFDLIEALAQPCEPPIGGWESVIREHAARIAGCHNRKQETKLTMLRDLRDTVSACAEVYPPTLHASDPANDRLHTVSNCAFHIAFLDRRAPHMEWSAKEERKFYHRAVTQLARALYFLGTDHGVAGREGLEGERAVATRQIEGSTGYNGPLGSEGEKHAAPCQPVVQEIIDEIERQIRNVEKRHHHKQALRERQRMSAVSHIPWIEPLEDPLPRAAEPVVQAQSIERAAEPLVQPAAPLGRAVTG